jgi:hypothetical protein
MKIDLKGYKTRMFDKDRKPINTFCKDCKNEVDLVYFVTAEKSVMVCEKCMKKK